MSEVRIDIIAEDHGAPSKIRQTEGALKGVGDQGKTTGGTLDGLWAKFAAGQLVADAAGKAIGAFTDFVVDSYKAALEADKAEQGLKMALETTGRTVEPLTDHFKKYASALQTQTNVEDEAIMGAQALLLQLTRLDKDGIDQATRGAIGLSKVFDLDLKSSARAVAQAYEGNFMAIGRMIPAVRDAKTEGEKLAAMQNGLNQMFNRAQGETDTFSGKLDAFKRILGDSQEIVGNAIVQHEGLGKALSMAAKALRDIVDSGVLERWISKLSQTPVLGKLVQGMMEWAALLEIVAAKEMHATRVNDGIATSFDTIAKVFSPLAPALKGIVGDFDGLARALGLTKAPLNEVGTGTKHVKDEIVKLKETKLEKSLWDMKKVYSLLADSINGEALPAHRQMVAIVEKAVGKFQDGYTWTRKWGQGAAEWAVKNQQAFQMVFDTANSITSQIDGIMQQSLTNRLAALDKEYQARLENIKNSKMSEEEKQEAIQALEAEYDMKRREAQRKAAEQGKALAIAQAVINVAEGVTKALSALPPPFNIALAAITAALGAVQIALIKSQPIPLAKGGILDQPTLSPDGKFLAGEAGPEAVIPLKEMPRMVREIMKLDGGGFGNSRPIVIINKIILDGKEMKAFITQVVRQSGGLGLLGETGRSFA